MLTSLYKALLKGMRHKALLSDESFLRNKNQIIHQYLMQISNTKLKLNPLTSIFACLSGDRSPDIRMSVWMEGYIKMCLYTYTGCPRRNVPDFGRVFLMLKYTDITQNTYVQSWTVTEIMAREKCGLLAGPRTVPVSWQSYPFTSLSVVSHNGISAHASHWTAHVGLYRNARSAMLRHRWAVVCHV